MKIYFLLLTLLLGITATAPSAANIIRVPNRAQCALDSDFPTRSVFLIIDGYNAGRLAYAVGKQAGDDPDKMAQIGMSEFRLSVTQLQILILDDLLQGRLPVLPRQFDQKERSLNQFQKLSQLCAEQNKCTEMQSYLQKIWQARGSASQISAVDNFRNEHFLNLSLSSRCQYLKTFSPIQAQLHSAGLEADGLQNLAQAVMHPEQFMASCLDQSQDLNSQNVALQFDIPVTDEQWQKIGFDFWNSVKVYSSWAWRNAPEMKGFSTVYSKLFRSVDLEESIMMMSNGCNSISPPACDQETLTSNAVRELAKQENNPTDFDKLVPNSAADDMAAKGARSVSNDFLGTHNDAAASAWVANFRKKFTENRWIFKNKLLSSLQNMSLIASQFKANDLAALSKDLVRQTEHYPPLRDELAYMCLELRLAGDQKINFLRSQIDRINQYQKISQIDSPVGLSIPQQIQYFQNVSDALMPLCNDLESNKFFQQTFQEGREIIDWSGLQDWAKELTQKSMKLTQSAVPFAPTLLNSGPLLTTGNNAVTVCANSVDCVRLVLRSAVNLYYVSSYLDAFAPRAEQIASPDVFNPYSELKACKVYDPWYVSQSVRKKFIFDLMNTAVFGWNSLPLYMDVDFTPPKVTSFNELMQNGHLKYDPQVESSKMITSLIADFGPLLGAPCAVQITPGGDRSFNFYAFSGISLNYCSVNAHQTGMATDGRNANMDPTKMSSYCAGCSLNFVAVPAAAANAGISMGFNPLKFGVYLFRSIYRFITGMKDPVNIPHTQIIDLDKLVASYNRFGKIPAYCTQLLTQGKDCIDQMQVPQKRGSCSQITIDQFEQVTGYKPKHAVQDSSQFLLTTYNVMHVESDFCEGSIEMPLNCTRLYSFADYPRNTMSGATPDCRSKIQAAGL